MKTQRDMKTSIQQQIENELGYEVSMVKEDSELAIFSSSDSTTMAVRITKNGKIKKNNIRLF